MINPKRACEATKSVVKGSVTQLNNGVFSRQSARTLWDQAYYGVNGRPNKQADT